MQTLETKHFSITRLTQGKLPSLPFLGMKEAVLGKQYDLSLVFPGIKQAEKLHKQWKKKSGPANILSFPIDDTTGEIFISLAQARREAKNFDYTFENYLAFLFIHGLFHLKGFDHGSTMEHEEAKMRKRFGIVTRT